MGFSQVRGAFTAVQRWFGRGIARFREYFDVVDGHIYGGLGLAAVGGWQLSPPWTLVAIGAALVLLGVFGSRRV